MKLALKLGIQIYQILTNDDEVCIPSLFSILLAVSRPTAAAATTGIYEGRWTRPARYTCLEERFGLTLKPTKHLYHILIVFEVIEMTLDVEF